MIGESREGIRKEKGKGRGRVEGTDLEGAV